MSDGNNWLLQHWHAYDNSTQYKDLKMILSHYLMDFNLKKSQQFIVFILITYYG
jgi:hypothetical protein